MNMELANICISLTCSDCAQWMFLLSSSLSDCNSDFLCWFLRNFMISFSFYRFICLATNDFFLPAESVLLFLTNGTIEQRALFRTISPRCSSRSLGSYFGGRFEVLLFCATSWEKAIKLFSWLNSITDSTLPTVKLIESWFLTSCCDSLKLKVS